MTMFLAAGTITGRAEDGNWLVTLDHGEEGVVASFGCNREVGDRVYIGAGMPIIIGEAPPFEEDEVDKP